MTDTSDQPSPKNLYISYSRADYNWAKWITWQLEEAGYTVELPNIETRTRQNITQEIYEVAQKVACFIVLLSPDYIRTLYTLEWAIKLKQEVKDAQALLLQVRECNLKGVLGSIQYTNLVGQDESMARETLLASIRRTKVHFNTYQDKAFQISQLKHSSTSAVYDIEGSRELGPSPLWNIPHSRNPFFTDREDILKRICHAFKRGNAETVIQPLAISGMAGIGKTQIALEYAYKYRSNYNVVLWAKADSYDTLFSNFVSIAHLLNLPERKETEQKRIITDVKDWLQTHTNWLLILDNVDNLLMIHDLIPSGNKGHILLTTRAQALGIIAQHIEVDKLSQTEGALFLLRRANIIAQKASLFEASDIDRSIAEKISQEMDGLPLALDQAGGYIQEIGCDLDGYLKLYRTQRTKLLQLYGTESVATTLLLSFKKIKDHSIAAELLRLCVFLYPDNIPEEIVLQGTRGFNSDLQYVPIDQLKLDLDTAIEELRKFSLIHRNPDDQTLSVHRLVQTVLKDSMSLDEQDWWAEQAVRAVHRAFPDNEFTVWHRYQLCFPHAQACVNLILQKEMAFPEAASLLRQVAFYLWQSAHYDQAEKYCKKALDIQQQAFETDHAEIAQTLTNLAKLYRTQSQYAKAEQMCQQALRIQEKTLGMDHPDTATTLNELGWLARTMGKYDEAESLLLRALAIRKQALEPKHLDTAQTLNDLAWLHYNQGRYTEAEPLHKEALMIRMQILGFIHPRVAASLNNLAWLYHTQGRYDQAEQIYQQALTIYKQTLGSEHPLVAQTLYNLASFYADEGNYAQAETYYRQALKIRKQALGSEHHDVALSLHGLAKLYYARGKYPQAESFYRQALAIWNKVLEPNHPHIAQTLNDLARLLRTLGKYSESERYHLQALEMRKKILGPNHPDVAQSLHSLARLYRTLGNYTKAQDCYQQALDIREKVLGATHPLVAQSLNSMARLYRIQGYYDRAEQLHKRAWDIRKQILGPDHPDIAQTLNNLAKLYQVQEKYIQAEDTCKQALNLWEKTLGTQHYYMALILNNYAEICLAQHKTSQAMELNQQALRIQENTLGSEHQHMALLLNNLAEIYWTQSDYTKAEANLKKALEIREHALGMNHPYLAFSLAILAKVYQNQGYYSEAEREFKRALAVRKQALGPDHPDIAASLNDLAQFYLVQNNFTQAEPLYQQALAMYKQILGANHPKIANILRGYSDLLSKTKREDEAEQLMKQAQMIEDERLQRDAT